MSIIKSVWGEGKLGEFSSNQAVDCTNLFSLAFNLIKPYLLEAPMLLNKEFNWLEKTTYVTRVLTSPDLLFTYLSQIYYNAEDPESEVPGISSRIQKTNTFKKIAKENQIYELIDITNIFLCFANIFSTKEAGVKENYKEVLEQNYHDYKLVNFYHITTHDLIFESYNDLLRYFDNLCKYFYFKIIITKQMLEQISTLATSVVSRTLNLKYILTPSFSYPGLLPVYAAEIEKTKTPYLVLSLAVNHCFDAMQKPVYYEDETPSLITFILKNILSSLRGSWENYLNCYSIFNNVITGVETSQPSNNVFTLTKGFSLGVNNIKIFSYNKTLKDFMAVVTMGKSTDTLVYLSQELCENNFAPIGMNLISFFAIGPNLSVRRLNEVEQLALKSITKDLKMILA